MSLMRISNKSLFAAAAASLIGLTSQAATLSFIGSYQFVDVDSDGFREEINFAGVFGGSGLILGTTPTGDFIVFKNVLLPDLQLDPNSFVSGSHYDFNPNYYAGGFAIVDSGGNEFLTADLSVDTLQVLGTTGYVNSELSINLANIAAGADYVGGSAVIDEFLSPTTSGAANLTLQATVLIDDLIENVTPGSTSDMYSYSGSVLTVPAPPPPIPTPAALGGGIVLAGGLLARRRR